MPAVYVIGGGALGARVLETARECGLELIVTDPCGASDTCSAKITVTCPVGPVLEVSPKDVVITSVALGDTACSKITVSNSGDDTLTVASLTGCDTGDFFLDQTGFSTTLAPGDTTCFEVCFVATTSGPDSCEVTVDSDGGFCVISIVVSSVTAVPNQGGVKSKLVLAAVTPNPFNASAEIRFSLTERSPVRVEVFDFQGRKVRTLAEGDVRPAGETHLSWDGKDARGGPVAAGIYFVRVASNAETRTVRLVRMH